MGSMPKDLHPNFIPQLVMENWRKLYPDQESCPGVIYIDMWPLAPPLAFTIDPALANQFLQEPSMPKAKNAIDYLYPLTQNLDMVCAEGAKWKVWRTRFNPGFSSKNITALVPAMLDEVAVFRDTLRKKAGKDGSWGEVFPLEVETTNLTLDVIGRAALDVRLNEQTNGPSALHTALLDQLSLCMFDYNIFTFPKMISPRRHWKMAQNTKIMNDFLMPGVQARLGAAKEKAGTKTVVDLAVKTFNEEAVAEGKGAVPDKDFIDVVIAQLKIFIFAGHDTTATTICWVLHSLAKNPEVLAKVRAEHDSVFGSDYLAVLEQLQKSPHLLNQLPYTLAVIKESLRLFPSPGSIRDGTKKFAFTVSGSGVPYPTEGFMVWDGIRATMRWDEVWVKAKEFIPERWLVGPDDELYPKKNAWRPFGLGPRNCIGQELALTEIKMVVALVVREMDIDCAWDEWDALK
jgi:cytochrome P450